MRKKKRDWPVIASWLTSVALAAFFVIWGLIRGEPILGLLLIVVVIAVVTPFGIMFWALVSRWLGLRHRDLGLGVGGIGVRVPLTYHATPRDHWEACDSDRPYLPPDFDADGFIHCTDGADVLSIVLTTYYKHEPGDWIVLSIDKDRVSSPFRYEDPDNLFPHIYGPLNRGAITEVRDIARSDDGSFLPLADA